MRTVGAPFEGSTTTRRKRVVLFKRARRLVSNLGARATAAPTGASTAGGMDDDEIDGWLDSSDDEAGEASAAPPRTPSFLAETTPDSTPAREAVAAAPAEEAPAAAAVAESPAGVEKALKEAPAAPPPAPPGDPTPSAASVEPPARALETAVEPNAPVAEEMTVLSLSSPKAAENRYGDLHGEPPSRLDERVVSTGPLATNDDEARVTPEEPTATVSASDDDRDGTSAPAAPAGDAGDGTIATRETHETHETRETHETHAFSSLDAVGGGDGEMDPAWTLRRAGGGAERSPSERSRTKSAFGFGSLLGASLGSVTAAVRAAARSDLARDALDHARGVGKELGTLAKHVAGEDRVGAEGALRDGEARVASGDGEDAPPSPEPDSDDLWGAFGAMAKHAAKSLETVATTVTADPNVRRVASSSAAAARRAAAVVETKTLDFLERSLDPNATRLSERARRLAAMADADGAALERALIERGCAAHLETLETLADAADALAAEAWHETRASRDVSAAAAAAARRSAFRPEVLAAADAALDVERAVRDGESPLSVEALEAAASAAGGGVPGEDASELTSSMRADGEAVARAAAAEALGAFFATIRAAKEAEKEAPAPDGDDARARSTELTESTESTDRPSPESIEASMVASLEPVRRESAARVADVAAAAVAHLADVAAALESAPGDSGRSSSEHRWPSPSSKTSEDDGAPASIALARARLIGARVRAMAADAAGIADAFAAATTAAFSADGSGVDVDVDSGDSAAPVPESVASLFPDPETFSAFAASVETHARTTAERLKEVAMGYAADASRCLRAAVAASAEDAAASSR